MNRLLIFIVSLVFLIGCKTKALPESDMVHEAKFKIAFGSCNKASLPNAFWDDVLALESDIFIWGGDNIYADTDDAELLRQYYEQQNAVADYQKLKAAIPITGTWDDHDYGINDGGVEFDFKKESQQLFLDFMGVPKDDKRRNREGIYSSQVLQKQGGLVKIINLDTRYFRTALTKDERPNRSYKPNPYGEGTVLGEAQWAWLTAELENSNADFNLIMSSIQFISGEHGFEKWANYPHEVDKMKQVIKDSGARGVIFLSGDRHISEFSKVDIGGSYPLIDFTSSGLTHAYTGFKGEPNRHRVGELVKINSFGFIELDAAQHTAHFKIMGDNGLVLQELKQRY